MAKYECEGQLSLFDFLESPKQENNVDRQRKIELEVVDMILNWTIANCRGWSKLPREERIKKAKECNSGSAGARQGYLWKCDAKGIDITFDEPIGKCLAVHIGWPMFDNRVLGKESEAAEQIECDGCIFETKSKCCGYNTKDDYCVLGNKKITNKLIKQLIDDLEAMYPGKIDVKEYTVWEHVPNLGKRLWLNIEDVGDTWDLTGIIDKYKEASLEVSISAVPHFVGGNAEGNNLYISTMWKTKGHKEVLEYEFKNEAAGQNVCKFSEHTCNKEELWKVAESFDDIECPKICCRNCKVKCCGARCNGSEEPKEEEPKCSKAKECEAYTKIPRGCGGSIEPCRWGGPFKWSEEDILGNDTQVTKSKRSSWIGDDYLKYISKAIKEKDKEKKEKEEELLNKPIVWKLGPHSSKSARTILLGSLISCLLHPGKSTEAINGSNKAFLFI